MKINIEKLKIAMAEKCLTNQGLCKKAKISLTTLATIKANKREPQTITVGKIAKALNIPVSELVDNE
jgi:transcriptional regulator with XRE-family HTH domain